MLHPCEENIDDIVCFHILAHIDDIVCKFSLNVSGRGVSWCEQNCGGCGHGRVQNEVIEGRNAVLEALRAGRALDKGLYRPRQERTKALAHIAGLARERR